MSWTEYLAYRKTNPPFTAPNDGKVRLYFARVFDVTIPLPEGIVDIIGMPHRQKLTLQDGKLTGQLDEDECDDIVAWRTRATL